MDSRFLLDSENSTPIFDFYYHNNLSIIHRTTCHTVRKFRNTYWSTNTFAPSVAICIARIICHRLSAAICIGRPICLCSSAAICIDRSICHRWRAAICIGQPICYPESAAICIDYTNMPPISRWLVESHGWRAWQECRWYVFCDSSNTLEDI